MFFRCIKQFFSKSISREYLRFDDSHKAEIFRSSISQNLVYLTIGSAAIVTISNLVFLKLEASEQHFGILSSMSAGILGIAGAGAVGIFLVAFPRTIKSIKMMKNMKEIEITFYRVILRNESKILDISDLSNLRHSYFGFHVTDSHKNGKLWILMRSNECKVYPGIQEMVEHVLNGNYIEPDALEKKVMKFRPK